MTEAIGTTRASGRRVTIEDIALPPPAISTEQDREWCVVRHGDRWRKIRFHDYDEIYDIPGLYETLFYEVLKCGSPAKIRQMLLDCTRSAGVAPGDLRVLDLGAGNGMVGQELVALGVRRMIGIDIIREAATAAERDRGDVYEDYLVADMADLPERDVVRLKTIEPNALVCVAALGFGDIPPAAFTEAFNLLQPGGWVAFNIKSDFLQSGDPTGFAGLVRRMISQGWISVRSRQRYRHRLAMNGDPLFYTGIVGVKNQDVPGVARP